jgi:hypothetical protein
MAISHERDEQWYASAGASERNCLAWCTFWEMIAWQRAYKPQATRKSIELRMVLSTTSFRRRPASTRQVSEFLADRSLRGRSYHAGSTGIRPEATLSTVRSACDVSGDAAESGDASQSAPLMVAIHQKPVTASKAAMLMHKFDQSQLEPALLLRTLSQKAMMPFVKYV